MIKRIIFLNVAFTLLAPCFLVGSATKMQTFRKFCAHKFLRSSDAELLQLSEEHIDLFIAETKRYLDLAKTLDWESYVLSEFAFQVAQDMIKMFDLNPLEVENDMKKSNFNEDVEGLQ